jgi:hypothetical protein
MAFANWFTSKMDGAIAVMAPGWAHQRAISRFQLSRTQKGIRAEGKLDSEKSPNTAPMDEPAHPDTDIIPDSGKHRRRCTLAYMNNSICRGIVDSQARQVVSSVQIQADTGNQRADGLIEDEWKRLQDGGLMEWLNTSAIHLFMDGGFVPHFLNRPSEPVEYETIPYRRIKTPYSGAASLDSTIRDGFKKDARALRDISCYVEDEESSYDNVYINGKFTTIPVVAHPTLPRLAGQTKGLPWYSAAMTRLEMINRWMESLLGAAELHASVVALIRTAAKDARPMMNGFATTTETAPTLDGTTTKKLQNYARAHKFLFLPDGGDYKIVQANAPQIAEFLIWNLRFVARALGVSFERLTYDLSNTSFSSTKFGDRDDLITVRYHQGVILRGLIKPIHKRLVAGLFLRPELRMPGAGLYATNPEQFETATFSLPGRPPVDELKAEKAIEQALKNRTTSRTRISAERGADVQDLEDEQIREDKRTIEKRTKLYTDAGFEKDLARDMAVEDVRAQYINLKVAAASEESLDETSDKQPQTLPLRKAA